MNICIKSYLYRVSPLKNALRTPNIRWQSQLEREDSGVECCQIIFVFTTGNNLENCLIKALLTWVLNSVVVGAQFEDEESLVVGGDINLDNNVLARSVLTSDDTICESSSRSLVLSRPGISWVSTDSTPPIVTTKLMLESSAESLVIIEVWRIVITKSPHGSSGGWLHQPGV